MKKLLALLISVAMVLSMAGAVSAAQAEKEVQVTFSTGETATAILGEPFVFFFQCDAPGDMGEIAEGEEGAGIIVSDGEVTYSNVSLGGPFSYPTSELVTITDFDGDFEVTVAEAATQMDAAHTIYFTEEDIEAAIKTAEEMAAQMAANPMGGDSEGGESPDGESPEGESPEEELTEAPAEGESAEGESEDGESAGESASSGGSESPMQEIVLTDGADETYENILWEGTGGYLALIGATAHVGGDEDHYPVEEVKVPVTEKYFDASAVEFDGGVNSIFAGTQDAAGGGATFNVTGEGSNLYVNNALISSQGSQTAAMYVDENDNKVVVKDSYLESFGSVDGYEDVMDFIALQGLLSWGHTRTNLSQGVTSTYYYNSAVVADGWAAMSTDGATGLGVNFVSVNSYAETADGGYAIYSDHECRDYVFGSTLVGAEYGGIIAAGGELYLLNGHAVDMENTELNGWRQEFIDAHPANLMSTSYQDFAKDHPVIALEEYDGDPMEVGRTTIVGGRNCVLMHKPDEGHEGLPAATQNVLYAEGVDFVVDKDLFNLEDMPEGWYTPDDVTSSASMFYPETLNYVEFTSGPAILMRSCSTLVYLDDVTFTSNYDDETGQADAFIMSVMNSDGNANLIPDGEAASPMDITIANSEIEGNIIDMDYQREMLVNLDGTTLTGRIDWTDVDDWNTLWGEDGVLGQGTYQYDDSYETVWGPVVTLQNGSVWNVTEISYVKDLIVDDTSTVNGTIEEVEDGFIVTPAEGESQEGESGGGLALQTEEYEITVGDVTAMAQYEDLAADSEQRAFKITFDGKEYTGKIDKGVWTADDPSGEEVIAAYQTAHEADPNFMGAPAGGSESGESPEGESPDDEAPAAGDTSEEAYHAYLKEFVRAVPAVTEDHYPDFDAAIDASTYDVFPADMMFTDQWWGYAAMTYDEFVAADGVYEIPAFDPDLKED